MYMYRLYYNSLHYSIFDIHVHADLHKAKVRTRDAPNITTMVCIYGREDASMDIGEKMHQCETCTNCLTCSGRAAVREMV